MKYIKRKKIEFNSDNEEKTLLTIGNCLKTKNRFDFLYENAKIIRRKIEMEKMIKEAKEKNDRNHPINRDSLKIINRKGKSFQNINKKNKNQIELEESFDQNNLLMTKSNNSRNKGINNYFSFQPLINEKSILIAKSLPVKSNERLKSLSQKQKKLRETIIEKRKENYEIKSNIDDIKENKRCNDLYLKGMKSFKNKEILMYKAEKEKNNFYKQFSYKPQVNLKKNSTQSSKKNIYQRNNLWKENIERRNIKKKNEIYLKRNKSENFEYTFIPKINKDIMEIDKSFIQSHISEYVTFVNRFNQKSKKEFIEKKPIYNYSFYVSKKKIISNFNTEKRINNSILNKKKDLRLNSNNSLKKIEKNRNELGITNFFSETQRKILFSSYNYINNFLVKNKSYSFTFSGAVKNLVKQIK